MATAENSVPTSNGKGPKDYSLHVTNMPLEIDKIGAESLFRTYGEVTGVILLKGSKDTQQAYVSYLKYSEAEKAINDLNNKPPLNLNVEFKDKNLRNQHQITTGIDLSRPVSDFRYKNSSYQCTKLDMSTANCTPHMEPPNYTTEDELLYEVPTNPAIFNPYSSNSGPYRETNLMFTRGLAYVSKDGRRHVAHGRGYTFYHLPEPHYDIGTYLQQELEKRENGCYEYATEDFEDEVGNCKICSTPTLLRCQKCTTAFYCNRACQLSDWPKHRHECQPIPPLVKRINKTSQQNGHGIPPSKTETDKVPANQTVQQLRRPKPQPTQSETIRSTTAPPVEQRSSITTEKEIQKASPATSMKNGAVSQRPQENKDDLFKVSMPANFKADTASFPSKQQQHQQKQTRPINTNRRTTVSSEENIVFQSQAFIPKDKFIKVVIAVPQEEGEYWVQRVEDEGAITDLLCNLRQYARSTKSVPPEANVKCIVKTDDFYRATIISFVNNLAKIFYYDFGTLEELEIKEVWPINGFESIPPYARKIRMADDSDPKLKTLESGETLLVKATSITQDGVITVKAQLVSSGNGKAVTTSAETVNASVEKVEKQMASCSLKTDVSKPSSTSTIVSSELEKLAYQKLANFSNIIDHVRVGQTGLMLTSNQIGVNEYSGTLVPESMMEEFGKLFGDLKDASLEFKSTFKPKVGDLVSALESDDSWFRGIVLSNSPIVRIALLDECRVIAPIKCVPLTENFEKIHSMGLILKFPKETVVPQAEGFNFTIISLSDGIPTLSVKFESTFESTVTLHKWTPKSEQKGLLVPKLLSGHQVCITEFLSQNSIHVQSVESSEKERIFKLHQEIAKYSLEKKPLSEIPVVGTIVLALFEADNNYYRAIVTKLEDQKVLIKYIDYGNQEIVTLSKLFELPDILKEHPSCVAEVSLKNVDKNVPLTEAATIYMQELIGGEVPLICTFDGNPLENGVILKSSATNEIVNDKLSVLLKPTWKQEKEEDKTVYGIGDLPSIKLGDVGDSLQAAFLCYYHETGTIFFGPNDLDVITAIQEQTGKQIAKYVAAKPDHYIPRSNELCIAKYLEEFYRALCLESSVSPTESSIFFIDYGNTELVNHKDIRIFAEDFLKVGAYATLCNISPVVPPEKFNRKVSQRINEILVPNEIYEIKIISVDEDGALNVDIPALRLALMQEKLI